MWRVSTEERGVTAVIVAICATVLFGIGALVVDVGAGFQEKRELQNGADAAALALAQDCALGNCNNLNTKAVEYANLNAKDGASRATANTIAGHGVKVVTRTNDAGPNSDGDVNTVDFQLAPVFGGPRGGEVAATATARWAPPAGGSTFPLTFSLCEFNKLVVGGVFSPTPQVIYFHEINSGNAAADPCAAQAGQDYDGDTKLNGGFGWLENGPNPPPCKALVTVAGWVAEKSGVAPPNAPCQPSMLQDQDVFLPVFDDVIANGGQSRCGSNKCYHIFGMATFHVTGFRITGQWKWNEPCSPPKTCIAGVFKAFKLGVFDGGPTGGPDLGTNIVFLTD